MTLPPAPMRRYTNIHRPKNSSAMATTKYHSEKRARGGIAFDGRRAGGAANTFLRSRHQEGSWGRRAPRGSGVLSVGIGSFFIAVSPYASFSELYQLLPRG